MAILVDTNILLHSVQSHDPRYATIVRALASLRSAREMLCVTLQNLVEFWTAVEWENLITACSVSGKSSHDARLAATMLANGVGRILTYNGSDFKRFPGITVLDPLTF
jgi:predicted nucleic acid-binding protein